MNLNRLLLITIFVPSVFVVGLVLAIYFPHSWGLLNHRQEHLVLSAVLLVSIVPFSLFVNHVFRRIQRHMVEQNQNLARANQELKALSDQLKALNEASAAITGELSLERVLQKVVDTSRLLLAARYGALAVVEEGGSIIQFLSSGLAEEERERIGRQPSGRGLLGEVTRQGRPLRVDDIARHPAAVGFPPNHPPMHTFLGVPVVYQGSIIGNLYFTEKEDGEGFSERDEEVLGMFATQVAIAIENARLHQEVRALAVMTERERIAREMHDGLAQVLGYANTKAQAARELLRSGQVEKAGEQLEQLARAARETYVEVREGILALSSTPSPGRSLLEVVADYTHRVSELSGIPAELQVKGESQQYAFRPEVEVQLLRIIQEALTNVRKHSAASRATVRFAISDHHYLIQVEDNGSGFDPENLARGRWPHLGLQTMRERAEAIGARFRLDAAPGRGTQVVLELPRGGASEVEAV